MLTVSRAEGAVRLFWNVYSEFGISRSRKWGVSV